MPTSDCAHCAWVTLLTQHLKTLCRLCEELDTLLAVLKEKHEAETRFWKRMLTELERKG